MKLLIIIFILFSTSCYCERLLGGWTESDDDSLKSFWLSQGIQKIFGLQSDNALQSQATNLKCITQIVNGLNIKCTFVINGEKYECSYYKSFVQTIETKVDECNSLGREQDASNGKESQPVEPVQNSPEDKENQPVQNDVEHDDENDEVETENEGEKEEAQTKNENEDGDEKEELVAANEGEKEGQEGASNKDSDEEEPEAAPAPANEDEKEKQVAQESLIANDGEDDDEAQIDALNKEMSERNAKNEEGEQQQQQ